MNGGQLGILLGLTDPMNGYTCSINMKFATNDISVLRFFLIKRRVNILVQCFRKKNNRLCDYTEDKVR